MKKTNIIYWIFTGLMLALFGPGAVFDAISAPEAVTYITDLGYPAYIIPFLGVAKMLAIIAILVPGFPRVKEWAYAGLTYDLIGALYSHLAQGLPATQWMTLFIGFALIAGSYIYHHKRLRGTDRDVQLQTV